MSLAQIVGGVRDTLALVAGPAAVTRLAQVIPGADQAGVSTNSVIIALAIAILGWQMRKLLAANDRLTSEMVTVRLILTGDGRSVPGIGNDLQRLALQFAASQENRGTLLQDWSIWRARVDDTLVDVTGGRYSPDPRHGTPGRRRTDFLGPTQPDGDAGERGGPS